MVSLAVSPCSNPEMGLDEVLEAYSELGFTRFEAFSSWTKSSLDPGADPAQYVERAKRYGMTYSSLHLPPVEDDTGESFQRAVEWIRFAEAIGAPVALFKAKSREVYVEAGKRFLDAVEGVNVTPVLQNHFGTPITTLEDFREVIEGIDDQRMKALLEVGHFHKAGVSWREGCDLLGGSIALVHIKDQVGAQSVPFGAGEVDLEGLFRHMDSVGYRGDFVVEMEVKDRENTLRYLADALSYVEAACG